MGSELDLRALTISIAIGIRSFLTRLLLNRTWMNILVGSKCLHGLYQSGAAGRDKGTRKS